MNLDKRQNLSKFLARYEIYKLICNIHGSIVECGVGDGTGLKTWALLSAIFEPVNHPRRIIGFDTFEGHKSVSSIDNTEEGKLNFGGYEELKNWIVDYDKNRFVNDIPKIELVKGNAVTEIPKYLDKNQQLIISLLNLDFDIYEPTKTALNYFVSRMPKGAVIVLDELNNPDWKGETQALNEIIGVSKIKLQRFPFTSTISYAIL